MDRSPGLGFLCVSSALGGAELNAANLMRWMRDRGWRCAAFGTRASPFIETAMENGFCCATVAPGERVRPLTAAYRTARATKDAEIGILFTFSGLDSHIGAAASVLGRRRMHAIFYQQMQIGRPKRDILHSLEYRLLAAWITPLPWLARQAIELTRVQPGKIVIIPHGIELERFRKNAASRAAARAGLGLPETAFTAGVIGRLDRGKGQEFLLRAAAELKDEGRDLRVLIVGEETRNERQNYGALLRERTAQLGISDMVDFFPFRSDIEKVFHALDVFVLTSLSETYGLVTIEAMASGLPVIGTDAAGTPEILRDGETGLLVKPGDPAELAGALRRVMDDPMELSRMGEQALADAELRFSHLKQCIELERLILRITSV